MHNSEQYEALVDQFDRMNLELEAFWVDADETLRIAELVLELEKFEVVALATKIYQQRVTLGRRRLAAGRALSAEAMLEVRKQLAQVDAWRVERDVRFALSAETGYFTERISAALQKASEELEGVQVLLEDLRTTESSLRPPRLIPA